MSRVYLAITDHDDLPRLVVQKVLLATLAQEPEFIDMFVDEARLSARFDHPNVVKVYDVQPDGDEPYMLLEYLDGASLESLIRKTKDAGGMPLALQLHAIAQAAHGLQYAHDLSDASGKPLAIVHRDVSPHNVFITFDGAVKVLDFGVAKAADSHHETKTGTMKGKFAYMAPEQLADSKRVDHRADVFGLGVMMWQAAMKRRPWAGRSDIEVARALLRSGLPKCESTPENPIDDALTEIIHRATARAPEDRYPTASELAEDIQRYLSRLPDKAGPRRLGTWASQVMAARRAKMKALLDAPSSGPAVGPPSSGSFPIEAPPLSRPASLTPCPPSSLGERSGSHPLTEPPPSFTAHGAPAGKRATLLTGLAVGAILLSATAVGVTALRGLGPPAAEADIMSLSIRVSPSTAEVFLDGARLEVSSNTRLRRDTTEHVLRAEAAGYRPAQQKLRYDETKKAVTIVLAQTSP